MDPRAQTSLPLDSIPFKDGIAALLPELRRRALLLTRDASRADDLVQDTVERALRFESTFRSGGYLRAWLMRIMQNVFISRRRRAGTERRILERAGVDPNGWVSLTATNLMPDLSPPVAQALRELSPHLEEVVRLVDLDEASYRDAACAKDVPVGTIMSRLHRGRAKLREVLSSPIAA